MFLVLACSGYFCTQLPSFLKVKFTYACIRMLLFILFIGLFIIHFSFSLAFFMVA
uniref:Uncharacterized protein n=1 Tax=Arundo donax TaxID=35708 RepID=A0A0A9G2A3_ARUDO